MATSEDPEIVSVSRKGQATIPKDLRERFGIETPGEVFVYEHEGRIVIEPVPTMEELHGIHADDHEQGEAMEQAREWLSEDEALTEAKRRRILDRDGE